MKADFHVLDCLESILQKFALRYLAPIFHTVDLKIPTQSTSTRSIKWDDVRLVICNQPDRSTAFLNSEKTL